MNATTATTMKTISTSKTTTTNDDPWLILLGWADEQVEKDLCHGS